MEETIVNRVAGSSLIQVDLEDWYPKMDRVSFDLADFLWERLILKELDYRHALKIYPWEALTGKLVAIYCSEDAIIPTWAFMLAWGFLLSNPDLF